MSTLARNKQINYDFTIVEEFEAGLELNGNEVKAIKSSHLSLKGAFVSIKDGEAWLKNLYVSPYKKAAEQAPKTSPERIRKLLLNKKEIIHLFNKTKEKGLTIIPISVYTTRRIIKVKIALVKGKKKFDKREDIKKRDIKRAMAQKIKDSN